MKKLRISIDANLGDISPLDWVLERQHYMKAVDSNMTRAGGAPRHLPRHDPTADLRFPRLVD